MSADAKAPMWFREPLVRCLGDSSRLQLSEAERREARLCVARAAGVLMLSACGYNASVAQARPLGRPAQRTPKRIDGGLAGLRMYGHLPACLPSIVEAAQRNDFGFFVRLGKTLEKLAPMRGVNPEAWLRGYELEVFLLDHWDRRRGGMPPFCMLSLAVLTELCQHSLGKDPQTGIISAARLKPDQIRSALRRLGLSHMRAEFRACALYHRGRRKDGAREPYEPVFLVYDLARENMNRELKDFAKNEPNRNRREGDRRPPIPIDPPRPDPERPWIKRLEG